MSDVKQLTTAAAGETEPDVQALLDIYRVLGTIEEADWDRIIESAKIMARGPQRPARAPRSDKGRKRKGGEVQKHSATCSVNIGLLCDCAVTS